MVMGQVRAMRALSGCGIDRTSKPKRTSVWQRLLWPAMRARQLNAEERERLRRQRSEMRIILERCKALGGRAYPNEYLNGIHC